jgi:hypothetical protein
VCQWCLYDLDSDGFIGPGELAGFAGCFGLLCDPCATCRGARGGMSRTGGADGLGEAIAIEFVTASVPTPVLVAGRGPLSDDGFLVGRPGYIEVRAQVARGQGGLAAVRVDLECNSTLLVVE